MPSGLQPRPVVTSNDQGKINSLGDESKAETRIRKAIISKDEWCILTLYKKNNGLVILYSTMWNDHREILSDLNVT